MESRIEAIKSYIESYAESKGYAAEFIGAFKTSHINLVIKLPGNCEKTSLGVSKTYSVYEFHTFTIDQFIRMAKKQIKELEVTILNAAKCPYLAKKYLVRK